MQDREAAVLWAEIVAPLTDAMRFINGKQTEQALRVERIKLRQKARRVDALRRRIQQGDLAFSQAQLNGAGFVLAECGI